jgi:hypothetical protein
VFYLFCSLSSSPLKKLQNRFSLLIYIPAGIFVSGSLNIVYNLADLWGEEDPLIKVEGEGGEENPKSILLEEMDRETLSRMPE